jgi:hypothetical protein
VSGRDLVVGLVRPVARASRAGVALPLEITARLYGSTDKGRHGYISGYVEHLGPRRWRTNRVLEIGVGGYDSLEPGGSLRLWRDYCPRAVVVGMDIADKDVRLGQRVRFVQGDQSEPSDLDRTLEALGGSPDVVIDDGSHLAEHAAISFGHLFPTMASGSLYVIEDLHTSYWSDYGGGVPAPAASAVGFLHTLVDVVQAADPVFDWLPDLDAPPVARADIAALDVRPGIAFITKA